VGFLSGAGSLFAQPGIQAIAGGLLSGVVAGTALVATGIVPVGDGGATAATIELLACPGSGPVLADVADGESLLVTARSADGTWLEVYVGDPGVDRGWAPASALKLDSAATGLPIGGCIGPTPAPLQSPAPTPTATPPVEGTLVPHESEPPTEAPTEAPTPSPTPTPHVTAKPTPTPHVTAKPTPTPHTATPTPHTPPPTTPPTPTPNPGPVLSNLTASPNSYCNGPTSTITVDASDSSGIQVVRITYTPPGASPIGPVNMEYMGGTLWRYFITPSGWNTGFVAYHVTAYDTYGATTTQNNVNDFNDPSYLVIPDFC
jgi:hypothetical protein